MEMVSERIRDTGSRSTKESALRDFVRFARRTTTGLGSVAETEARVLVRRLTQLGRIESQEEETLLRSLLGRMTQSRRNLESHVEASLRVAAEKIHALSLRELDRLSKRTADLEQRVEEFERKKSRS